MVIFRATLFILVSSSLYLIAGAEGIQAQKQRDDGASSGKPIPIENMVKIRAGSYFMGSVENEIQREGPQTKVTISHDFWMRKFEVTQKEFEELMGSNPSPDKGTDLPVFNTTWSEAMTYCQELTERERELGNLSEGYVYRLPTTAEWEYACRAGTTTSYSFGDDENKLGEYAWFKGNSDGRTHPVGQKRPNPWGLYDVHGNVWEWCQGWHAARLPGGQVTDPTGPEMGSGREPRGGGRSCRAPLCRSAYRLVKGVDPSRPLIIAGLRVVLARQLSSEGAE